MAYAPHTLVAFGGALTEVTTGDEVWECTVRGYSPGGSFLPLVDPAGYMDEIAGPLSDWFTLAAHKLSVSSSLAWLKVNNIGADGRYSDPDTNVHDYAPPVNGGGAPQAPSFLSVAISWTTDRARPPGAFGRIYPPNHCVTFTGSAISGTDRGAILTSGSDLLDVLRNCSGDLQMVPVIASRVNATNTEITGVRVGNVYDVQRRRKNAVREDYAAAAWDSSCL